MNDSYKNIIDKSNEINGILNSLESDKSFSSYSPSNQPENDKSLSDDGLEKALKIISKVLLIFISFLICTLFFYFMQVIAINLFNHIWIGGISILVIIFDLFLGDFLKKIKLKIHFNSRVLKVRIIICVIILSIIVSAILAHFKPTYTWASEVSKNIFNSMSSMMNSEENNEYISKSDYQLDKNENSLNLNEEQNNYNQTFIINNENLLEKIDNQLKTDAYLNEKFKTGEFLYELNNKFCSKVGNENQIEFNRVQALEDSFLNKKEYAENQKNKISYEDWYQLLPSENELLNIILNQEKIGKLYPNYQIFKKISNNYQRLALEYINQNSYSATIKYYYLKSISYDIKSIEYAETEKEYNCVLNRLYYRFNDINENCINDNEEKEKLLFMLDELKMYK